MLLGMDLRGFVRRKDVPEALRYSPEDWYLPNPGGASEPLPRVGPYVDPDSLELVKTNELFGQPDTTTISADNDVPVIVDSFGRPVLYYVANPFIAAKPNGLIAAQDDVTPAIYNFLDNAGFTGCADCSSAGFDFGAGMLPDGNYHKISLFGDADDPGAFPESFVHYIHDHAVGEPPSPSEPHTLVAPHKRDSYLLITAGKDAIYGNADDVNNFEHRQ
jgi:hypothetical protein